MIQVIFHIGMGKTGTTSLQDTLTRSSAVLEDAGIRYLGMWQDLISNDYADFDGFQAFRTLSSERQVEAAERLTEALDAISLAERIDRFIFSNEQYFQNVDHLGPFFERLSHKLDLRFFIWVRPVTSWLPSACAQWGILHKTNTGPVQTFSEQADRLLPMYEHLPRWVELFGDRVTIRRFDETTDPVADLSKLLELPLVASETRLQGRPDPVDLLLRAAFNTQFDEMVLPQAYDAAMGRHRPLTGARGLRNKTGLLLGHDAMPQVITRHKAMLDEVSRAAGFDITTASGAEPSQLSEAALVDHVLGRAIEIIAGQARELDDLRSRIEALEKRQSD